MNHDRATAPDPPESGNEHNADAPLVRRKAPRRPRAEARTRGKPHYAIDADLSEADRRAYEALLSDPRTTMRAAHQWLKARGYEVPRPATRNDDEPFTPDLPDLRRTARQAARYVRAAHGSRSEEMAVATLVRIEQAILLHVFGAKPGADDAIEGAATLDVARLGALVRILSSSVATRQRLLALRKQLDDNRRLAGRTGPIGPVIAQRLREMLGIPMPDAEAEQKPAPPSPASDALPREGAA